MTRAEDKKKELRYARRHAPASAAARWSAANQPCASARTSASCSQAVEASALEVVRAMDQGIAAGRGAKIKLKKRVVAALAAQDVGAHINISVSDGAAGVLKPPTRC